MRSGALSGSSRAISVSAEDARALSRRPLTVADTRRTTRPDTVSVCWKLTGMESLESSSATSRSWAGVRVGATSSNPPLPAVRRSANSTGPVSALPRSMTNTPRSANSWANARVGAAARATPSRAHGRIRLLPGAAGAVRAEHALADAVLDQRIEPLPALGRGARRVADRAGRQRGQRERRAAAVAPEVLVRQDTVHGARHVHEVGPPEQEQRGGPL